MTYAARTDVSVERTKSEIERALTRWGASKFFAGWDHEQAVIGFSMSDRFVEFRLPLPDRMNFNRTPVTGISRSKAAADRAYEQAQRSVWRALLLCIVAKLESVESGIESFEEAFLAQILIPTPDGKTTVGRAMIPQIAVAYEGGTPRLELTP